jgi:hypothetical protein
MRVEPSRYLDHVMARGSLECGAGHEVIENLSHSAQRAHLRSRTFRLNLDASTLHYVAIPSLLPLRHGQRHAFHSRSLQEGWCAVPATILD